MPQPVSARPASQPPGLTGPAAGQDAPAASGFEEALQAAAGNGPPAAPGRAPGSAPGRTVEPAPHDRGLGLFRDRETPDDEREAESDRALSLSGVAEPVAATPGQPDAVAAAASQDASRAWLAAEVPLLAQLAALSPLVAPPFDARALTPPSRPDGSQARAASSPSPAGAGGSGLPAPTPEPDRVFSADAKTAATRDPSRPVLAPAPLTADVAVAPPGDVHASAAPPARQRARGATEGDASLPALGLLPATTAVRTAAQVGGSQATGLPVAPAMPSSPGAEVSSVEAARDAIGPTMPPDVAVSIARASAPTMLRSTSLEADADAASLLVRPAASQPAVSTDPGGIDGKLGRPAATRPAAALTRVTPVPLSDAILAAAQPSASMSVPGAEPSVGLGAEPDAESVRLHMPPAAPQPAFTAAPPGAGTERDLSRAAPAPTARTPRTVTAEPAQVAAQGEAEASSPRVALDAPGPVANPLGASPIGADPTGAGAGSFSQVLNLAERDLAAPQAREEGEATASAGHTAQPTSYLDGVLASASAPHVQASHAVAAPVPPNAEAAPAPSVAEQIAPAVVSMAQGRAAGHRLQVSITPDELGQVSITVERAVDGTTAVHVAAERAATLDLLRRDQADLARALDQAGAGAGGHSLSFSLSGGGGRMAGGGRDEPPAERQPASAALLYAEAPPPAASRAAARGGLDLTA